MTLATTTTSTTDRVIAAIAESSGGVVTSQSLLDASIGRGAVQRRVRMGRLIPVFRGIYLVGHAHLTPERLWWAATLAGGTGAGLSGRASLEARTLLVARPWEISVDIAPTMKSRQLVSLLPFDGRPVVATLHRPSAVRPVRQDGRWGWGVPLVDIHDAMFQVAATDRVDFDEAWRQAEYRRVLVDDQLRRRLVRGRPGTAAIRERLDRRALGSMRFQNALEEDGAELFMAFGMPRPLVNFVLVADGQRIRVDLYWPDLGLVIELDGGGAHESVGGRMLDRAAEAALRSTGLDVMRFNWHQVTRDGESVRRALIGAGYLVG